MDVEVAEGVVRTALVDVLSDHATIDHRLAGVDVDQFEQPLGQPLEHLVAVGRVHPPRGLAPRQVQPDRADDGVVVLGEPTPLC